MKRVLVLTTSYPKFKGDINGGFVHELSKRLTNDFEIFVLAPYAADTKNEEEIDGIRIFRHPQFFWNIELAYGAGIFEKLKSKPVYYFTLPFFFLFQLIWTLRICKKYNIQLIHAHWLLPNAFIASLSKLFNSKLKIIATIHGSDFWGLNNKVGTLLKKFTLNRIDKLTVVSTALKTGVIEFGCTKEISVYPMGIDTELFYPTSDNSSSLKEKHKVQGILILFVGIIAEAKGVKLLLTAMPDLVRTLKDVTLLVVGEGIQKKEMEHYANKLGMEANVIFTGSVPHNQLPSYYSAADVFILPSYAEGFGLVIAESMSCECLTIASDLPAVKDIIDKDINGFILGDLTVESIVKTISMAATLSNQQQMDIKKAARKKIVSSFDWKIVAENYRSLYRSV
ncbi:MAG: GDP-mannose-dependent alpha-(1-6)-phosphatidylinositol monomannoside mannosyltransferase [Bacteroidia bacterium]|nr:GDP-mannose-dependent alpha-(1-6)-phosphatidylinositol monomannoside mannosyltransferase [Bacteroidia bacterium]